MATHDEITALCESNPPMRVIAEDAYGATLGIGATIICVGQIEDGYMVWGGGYDPERIHPAVTDAFNHWRDTHPLRGFLADEQPQRDAATADPEGPILLADGLPAHLGAMTDKGVITAIRIDEVSILGPRKVWITTSHNGAARMPVGPESLQLDLTHRPTFLELAERVGEASALLRELWPSNVFELRDRWLQMGDK